MQHDLKCYSDYFEAVKDGTKNFECRYNDRDFQVGDQLRLMEYSEQTGYTGRYLERTISYVLTDFVGLSNGYVILGLEEKKTTLNVFGVPLTTVLIVYLVIFLLMQLYLHFG
ncbi:MAG: DUF3850 domain-containing protein [Streptococcus gallolyticus]|uniref:DUF3850 domain-containing protein n=1 Tax=Streptococcus gallolyticus TaxID=315405 RepID=A0A928A7R7_9STRE|nr:DUF3850 domain-containing protein [Streptococcus gallolyticus]